jgi:uncharacterized protein YjeT (DUF2065 family)
MMAKNLRLWGTVLIVLGVLMAASYLDSQMEEVCNACWRAHPWPYRALKNVGGAGIAVALAMLWQLAVSTLEKRQGKHNLPRRRSPT